MIPKPYQSLSEYQKEFSIWLKSQVFDTFGTFTTAKTLTLAGCRRMANRFSREFPLITMFWAAEPFSIRTGYHFHALIKSQDNGFIYYDNEKPSYRENFFEYWTKFKQFGRSDFQPISQEFGNNWTSEYITKYISKGLADYDIISPTNPAEMPESISYYHTKTEKARPIPSFNQYDAILKRQALRGKKAKSVRPLFV